MKEFNVGIFGWWYNGNYGAVLTYYSLNKALEKMGYSVKMLWRSSVTKELPDSVAVNFARNYYNISERLPKNRLYEYNDECDAFILGSDQLWNPDLESVSGDEFFLSFVKEGRVKIAYAQSFGNYLHLKKEFIDKYIDYVKSFDAVSVREDYAINVCREAFAVNAEHVCDPVFLSKRETYIELTKNAKKEVPNRFVVNFLLDPNKEKVQACQNVRSRLGIDEYINFTDLATTNEEKCRNEFQDEDVWVGAKIEDFVNAYNKADFIITDSFHGTCLAIILNKPFISIANHLRGSKRFESLLNGLELQNRLYNRVEDVYKADLLDIDYDKVNSIIEDNREKGLGWLHNAFRRYNSVTGVLDLDDECTGCGACVSTCGAKALLLTPNKWGYYTPSIDMNKCVACRKCVDVCPALNKPKKNVNNNPELYAFVASDETKLYNSTSGGVFTLLSEKILDKNGVVVGAAWEDDFSVKHIIVDNKKELVKLQKSKYMQSYSGDIIKQVKDLLDRGKKVLFSGCPCQIAGLKNAVGENKRLYLIDILCGNAPSSLFFKKYMDEFEGNVKKYTFRDKSVGWKADAVSIEMADGTIIRRNGPIEDIYQAMYHNHSMTPKHCENCEYQRIPRYGDITIGDFWGIDTKEITIDCRKGVSAVLCNNEKGKKLFSSIADNYCKVKQKVPLNWLGGNGFAVTGNNFKSRYRDRFYEAIVDKSFSDAVDYSLIIDDELYSSNSSYNNPIIYNSKQTHFHFDSSFWNEAFVRGNLTLFPTNINSPRGKFAYMMLTRYLKVGEKYKLIVRFRYRTKDEYIHFHTIAAGTTDLQIIKRYKTSAEDIGKTITIEQDFICEKSGQNAFSVGAAQFRGSDAFIAFEYIEIR